MASRYSLALSFPILAFLLKRDESFTGMNSADTYKLDSHASVTPAHPHPSSTHTVAILARRAGPRPRRPGMDMEDIPVRLVLDMEMEVLGEPGLDTGVERPTRSKSSPSRPSRSA